MTGVIDTGMKALAEELANGDAGLDFSPASLKRIEEGIRRYSAHGVRKLGAYLGETILRNSVGGVTWVDFDAASSENANILSLGRDEHTSAVLRAQTSAGVVTFWFPLVKVAKYLSNGAQDSIWAFAEVAMVRSPEPPAPSLEVREDFNADARGAAEAFLAAPDRDTLRTFDHLLGTCVRASAHPAFYRAFGLDAAMFMRFLGQPAAGRGHQHFDPGACAAEHIACLLETRVEPRDQIWSALQAMLADRESPARRHAAYAVCRVHLHERAIAEAMQLASAGDAEARIGCLRALRHLAYEKEDAPDFELGPFVPLLESALAGKEEPLRLALDVVRVIVQRVKADVSSLLSRIVPLLDHAKPGVVEDALQIVYQQAFLVYHKRADYNERLGSSARRIADLTKPKADSKKITKVQIAAKYALLALDELGEHLDPTTHAVIRQSLEAAEHVA